MMYGSLIIREDFFSLFWNDEITAICFKGTIDFIKWSKTIAVSWRKTFYGFLIGREATATGFYPHLPACLGKSYGV